MGRKTKLRHIIGAVKDKASLSKAAILCKPNTFSLHLTILKATTHSQATPPHQKYLSTLISLGHGSRATASSVIEALMDRLHRTRDAYVCLKCLITVHYVIKHGSFILQDQLSVFPTFGGTNYLNLSDFRDSTTPNTWIMSSWVRWYASYLEQLLSTSRVLGFFLCSTSCTVEKDEEEEKILGFMNKDLLIEMDSLVALIEETCKAPDRLQQENKLNLEVMRLVGDDYLSLVNEVSLRLTEFKERKLIFGESVELACALRRLEDCKDRLSVLFNNKKVSAEMFWSLVSEMKSRVGMLKECREEGRLMRLGWKNKGSESARFGEPTIKRVDSVSFSSGRLHIKEFREPSIGGCDLQEFTTFS